MSIDKDNAIFLLGGHDLEMITIRDILDKQDIPYFDESQKWGAKLSDYSTRLEENSEKQFYAVELTIDDELLLEKYNIEIIDHHNEHSHKDASILQVLKILDLKVNREYELVAINDVSYIEGLKCKNATNKEISTIRRKDRMCQGVKREDYIAGVNDARSRKIINGIDIVCATTSYFSVITDALYLKEKSYNKTIIYNDEKMVLYGFEVYPLQEVCKKQKIDKSAYYYGGGDKGFFGFKESILTKEKFLKFKDAIVKNIKDKLYSSHIFMFPFIFNNEIEKVNEALLNAKWEKEYFNVSKSHKNYNEYMYFYEYARKALYNLKEDTENRMTSTYYEYKEKEGILTLNAQGNEYKLAIDGISMRIFETGVGILSVELLNYKYPESKDVLKINDFGRRLYPQYLSEDKCDPNKYSLDDVKYSFLSTSITLEMKNEDKVREDFSYYEIRNNLKEDVTNLPKYIHHLLGDSFSSRNNESQIHIEPIIDDRMFVISMYMNDYLANEMKKPDKEQYKYENNDFWYEYLFVDGNGITCKSKHMKKKFIEASSYDRWIENSTLFGVSRYSFVLLTKDDWFANNILKVHMYTMYFQIFSLLLAYRASILKFSQRVADINVNNDSNFKLEELQKEVSIIYSDYINFQNNLFFREVTAQDQGIELYNQALDIMGIEKQLKDLDQEIAELHTYVSMKMQEEEAKHANAREDRLETISKLGAVFLPPSLLAGIYGMNVFNFNKTEGTLYIALGAMVLSAVIGYASTYKKKEKEINYFYILIIALMIGVVFGSLEWIGEDKKTPKTKIENPVVCEIKEEPKFMEKLKIDMHKIITLVTKKEKDSNEINKTK